MSAEVVQLSLPLGDGLRNFVTGLGTRKDHTFGNRYFYVPMSMEQLDAAYAGDWLARKIIDIPPQDSTREWRTWQTDRAEQIYRIEKQFRVRSKVRKAQTLARLYGGAVIMIGDGASNSMLPLDMERFARGGLKYLHVFSRYEVVAEEEDLNPQSPTYGKPLFYRLRTRNQSERIHRSRFVFFMGSDAPRSIETVNEGWGQSVLDSVLQAVMNMTSTAQNTASLVEEAKVDVIKIPNLMTYVSQPKTTALLIERFTLANTLKSNHNALLLGGDEDFQRKQVTFAGLPEVMREQMQLASAAADIPMTRLMSQSPAGMNATGESDIRNYYDKIRAFQTTDLEEDLSLLDDVLVRHVFGNRRDEDTYEWNELWQMSEDERSQIALRNAQALQIYNNSNLFAPEELRPATADMIIDSGFLPTLDQHLLDENDFNELIAQQEQARVEAQTNAAANAGGGAPPGGAGGGPPNLRVVGGRGATDTLHALKDAEPRSLYIRRDVKNAAEIARWAKAQGFSTGALKASELHVTVIFSRTPVDWFDMGMSYSNEVRIKGGPRQLERLGEGKDAVVLLIPNTYELQYRHEELKEKGCSWDWPEYQPHITIAYDAEQTIDLDEVEPYQGEIVLGPEVFEEIDENWKARVTNKDGVEMTRRQRGHPFDAGFGAFEESEHPRGPGGKFAEKPDTSQTLTTPSKHIPWWLNKEVEADAWAKALGQRLEREYDAQREKLVQLSHSLIGTAMPKEINKLDAKQEKFVKQRYFDFYLVERMDELKEAQASGTVVPPPSAKAAAPSASASAGAAAQAVQKVVAQFNENPLTPTVQYGNAVGVKWGNKGKDKIPPAEAMTLIKVTAGGEKGFTVEINSNKLDAQTKVKLKETVEADLQKQIQAAGGTSVAAAPAAPSGPPSGTAKPRRMSPAQLQTAAEAQLEEEWKTVSPEEKINIFLGGYPGQKLKEQDTTPIAAPAKWDPLETHNDPEGENKPSEEDYRNTQKIVKAMFLHRVAQVMLERGVPGPDGQAHTPESAMQAAAHLDRQIWAQWKSSSTSREGMLLQQAVVEELGSRENKYAKPKAWLNETEHQAYLAHVRAKWEVSQFALESAGVQSANVYRALILKVPETAKQLQLNEKGEQVPTGQTGQFIKLPETHISRNGAASTSTNAKVPNSWQGTDTLVSKDNPRVVIRAVVPRSAMLSTPAFGINLQSEKEVVVAGTGWMGWDAWLHTAPTLEDVPMSDTIKRAKATDAEPTPEELREFKRRRDRTVVIAFPEIDGTGGHWLSGTQRSIASDAGFSGIAPQFEESEHPRDPSGKFAHKGGTGGKDLFAQKWENKKTGEKLVAYQPAATPVELAARITKVLKKGVSAHPPYRWRINKMIEQIHEFHEHQSSFQEQTSNIDKLVATLPLLKAKIAESFAEQANALHAKGEGAKAVKLALKAKELGYGGSVEPITAPVAAAKIEPVAPAKAAEAVAMAAGKKYYEEYVKKSDDPATAIPWEEMAPESQLWFLAKSAETAGASSGKPNIKPILTSKSVLVESADNWAKIGPQKGSNPGGLYQDPNGGKWYIKKPATAEHIAQDLLANKLYDAAGLDVPFEKPVMLGGSLAIASSIVENAKPLNEVGATVAEQTQKDLRRGFAVDAWLANWDVVGLTKDNVLVMNESWLPVRVDTGGTLEFRAQGGKKEFGAEVKEWDTLRDPKLNPNSAEVFKNLTKEEMIAYIKPVVGVTDTAIVNAVKESGASTHLADVLIARKNWLINKATELLGTPKPTEASLTQAASVAKPGTAPLDPANLTPDQIKAKKATPYPMPTLGGDPQGQAVASDLVTKFNEKYSGKEPQTVEELNAKIDAHKALKQQLDALKLTAQAKAQHSAAEQAKQAIASQAASLNLSQEDQAHLEVLSGIVGKDVSYYIGEGQKQAAAKVGLSVAEVALISAYTGSHYGPVNAQLRNGAITKQNYAYAKRLDKALRKLPASKGTTYRKANLPADVAAKYQPGMIIAERAFTSSSKQSHVWQGEYRYEIEGKSGRDVQKISTHKSEAEVLFPMNTHFEVEWVAGKTIKMREIDEEDL
jgi:phage-related protein (TIGR01555 family)